MKNDLAYIVTGAPGSGKTSTMEALARRLIEMPLLSPQERADFICNHLKKVCQ